MTTIININIGQQSVSAPALPPKKTRELPNPLPFIYAGLTPVNHPFGRAKNCVKGMVCGNSCISKSKKCSNGLSPAQKPAAKKAATKATKKTDPKATKNKETTPPPATPSTNSNQVQELRQELTAALSNKEESYDFSKVRDLAKQIKDDAEKVTLNPGEVDDKITKHLVQVSGYDAPAKVLDSKAFSDQVKEDNTPLLIRSVIDTDGKAAAEINEQLRSGEYHLGRGIYGNGIYATHTGENDGKSYQLKRGDDAATQKALDESRAYGETSLVMTFNKNAKVLLEKDAVEQIQKLDSQISKWEQSEIDKRAKSVAPPSQATIDQAKPSADEYRKKVDDFADSALSAGRGSDVFSGGKWDFKADPDGKSATLRVDYDNDGDTASATISVKLGKNPKTGKQDYYFEDSKGEPQWYGSTKDLDGVALGKNAKALNQFKKAAMAEAIIQQGTYGTPTEKESYQVAYGNYGKAMAKKEVSEEARLIRKTLLGDARKDGPSSRLATIMGYDAIAVEDANRYMNILNRGALSIRDKDLPPKTAALADLKSIGR